MSTNCVRCVKNERDSIHLLCAECRGAERFGITSRELSELLKDAGVTQESKKRWYWQNQKCACKKEHLKPGYAVKDSYMYWPENIYTPVASAFDCNELLVKILPAYIKKGEHRHHLYLRSLDIKGFSAGYSGLDLFYNCITPAEALGKLEIWRLKQGYCRE